MAFKKPSESIIPAEWNICPHCGVSRVSTGNYPECNEIIHDMPVIADMKSQEKARIVQEGFYFSNQTRCQFLNWMMRAGHAQVAPEAEWKEGRPLYILPEGFTLRPEAMCNLEKEIIQAAEIMTVDGLKYLVETYCTRSQNYFFKMQEFFISQTAAKVAQALRK